MLKSSEEFARGAPKSLQEVEIAGNSVFSVEYKFKEG